jgi:N,N'-diacetyllegionaminate synthase
MSVLIIAEIGSVHDGSFGNALKLVDAAKAAGADAVKFQTHIASEETLRSAPSPSYFTAEPRFEYFERTAFTPKQWEQLRRHCDTAGLKFLSSPFSEAAVDLLESIGMEMYKIPSGEVTNIPMLEKIARLKKPVLLSSGMSSWAELDRAVGTIRFHHNNITVLQCTSEYPCDPAHAGLNLLAEMRTRYHLPVGFSDHTRSVYASIAATLLGASVIEKHFTFSRSMYGSDAPNSLEPGEFASMVRGIREVETMLANPVDKNNVAQFATMKETFEKSIVSLTEIPAGTILSSKVIGIKKPGTGIPAARMPEIEGKRAARAIPADRLLDPSDIDWKA